MPPLVREKHVVKWLEEVSEEASAIYLVGDIFDFWWEYRSVVPKGFTRFLGTISGLTDKGIEVHFFTGNHDMWIGNYLSEECGMILHTGSLTTDLLGKTFYITHGEGLGTKDIFYKFLLRIFKNKVLRKLYSFVHPRLGLAIGHSWSRHSRLAKHYSSEFTGPEKEDLIRHALEVLRSEKIDYFIFGHRHIALEYSPENHESRIFFLGEWFSAPFYVSWDGREALLKEFSYHQQA